VFFKFGMEITIFVIFALVDIGLHKFRCHVNVREENGLLIYGPDVFCGAIEKYQFPLLDSFVECQRGDVAKAHNEEIFHGKSHSLSSRSMSETNAQSVDAI
jgi:hypothetical protein